MTKVLIAPITVTPTKALSPSHVKGLLWVDVMYRATSLIATDVTYLYSNTTFNTTAQTLGFWEYLDRTLGEVDYTEYGEEEIGELYMRFQAQPEHPPFAALRPYLRGVEATGWVHPVSNRLISLWQRHFAALGMYDPGLAKVSPPLFGQEEMIEYLVERDLCLDQRGLGGPVYVDATRFGLPLRQILTAEHQPNYLAGALRELLPICDRYDEIVLVHDRELTEDYVLLQRVLGAVGGNAVRDVVDRVPIDGVVRSSRHGGWQGYTVPAILAAFPDVEPDVLRLGMRLYLIAVLGRGCGPSFRMDVLRRTMKRADKLLAGAGSAQLANVELAARIDEYRGRSRHIDPYRLTTALLNRGRTPPVGDLVARVYC